MDTFFWGVITGAVVSPFAIEGMKWCYSKYKDLLSNS